MTPGVAQGYAALPLRGEFVVSPPMLLGKTLDSRNRPYGDAIDLSKSIVAFFGPKGQRSKALGNAQGKRSEKPNSPERATQKGLLGANVLAQAVSPLQG